MGVDELGWIAGQRRVHRLRDLDRRGMWLGLVLAAALLVAPLVAFGWAAPEWSAQGDPALMSLRALDVGTDRTPLTGQPSTGHMYVEVDRPVSHLGPTHFYLLAPAVRVLGANLGMPVVSTLIVSACLLVAAWAVFRQLGEAAGVVAVVALGLVTFTTGAGSLVDPVSSNIAGYPVLCSAVLVWCVLCGDLRLLPLAAGVVSFAAQQHLSSLPALSVAVVVGLGVLVVRLVRCRFWRDASARWAVVRWGAGGLGVALVLWSPVLLEQVAVSPGNLSAVVSFTSHDDRPVVGYGDGIRPLGHVLGLPPLLGRLNLTGSDLLDPVSWLRWLSAAAIGALVVVLGWRWRVDQPRRAALVVMAVALAVAGVLNASSMPVGLETTRLVFYHWVFALSFFLVLVVGLAAVDLVRARLPLSLGSSSRWRPALVGAAALVVAVPALVNPTLDRRSNQLANAHSPYPRALVDGLADEVMAQRDRVGDHPMLLVRNDNPYISLRDGVALELAERGLDVRYPRSSMWFVHGDRLAEAGRISGGIVLVVDDQIGRDEAADVGLTAEPFADVLDFDGFDLEAYDELVAAVEADEADFREALTATLAAVTDGDAAEMFGDALAAEGPAALLANRAVLELLRDHPLEEPRLDPELVERVLDTLPDADAVIYRARLYRLDVPQLQRFVEVGEL